MRKTILAMGTALLACAGSLPAHHSGSMYDPTPLWVTGTIVSFEDIDPHTITTLEERGADGQVRVWAVEGPSSSQLGRMGLDVDLPSIGDVIGFCAFPYKSAAELERIFPGADFSARRSRQDNGDASPQYVWGHVMVTADGERQLWNPHGMLGECIRSSEDPRQSWLDFLNSTPRAWWAWCQQRAYRHVQSNASLRELMDEINGSLNDPCE